MQSLSLNEPVPVECIFVISFRICLGLESSSARTWKHNRKSVTFVSPSDESTPWQSNLFTL